MDEAKTPAAMQAASSAPDAATKEVMDRMLRAVDLTQLRVQTVMSDPPTSSAPAPSPSRAPRRLRLQPAVPAKSWDPTNPNAMPNAHT